MIKAYKYNLQPTKEQAILLSKHCGCSRFIWNWALNKKTSEYTKTGKSLSRYELQAELPKMKKQEDFSWLSEVNSLSIQSKLEDLDKSFTAFFKKKSKYPNFKSKKDNQSFRVPQNTKVDWDNNKVIIPKFLEGIKFDSHRKFEGKVSSSYVSKSKTGKYYISILVEDSKTLPSKPKIKEAKTIGIDLGITNFITISNGDKVDNPKHLKKQLRKLRRKSKQHSKKKKGSNNREKSRLMLARVHDKVANSRKDFQHKLSYKLTHDNQVDTIVMETLSIKNMVKNHKLARHIQDCSWYQFQTLLKYKCEWYGKNFIQIGRFEPSTKMCSTCGYLNKDLKLSDRSWKCPQCNTSHDRDVNASINIKKLGMVQPEVKACGLPKKLSSNAKSGRKKQETAESLVQR